MKPCGAAWQAAAGCQSAHCRVRGGTGQPPRRFANLPHIEEFRPAA